MVTLPTPGRRFEHRHDALRGIVREIELVAAVVGRDELHDEQEVGRVLGDRDADAAYDLGQARLGECNAVLNQHLGLVEVGADAERDR